MSKDNLDRRTFLKGTSVALGSTALASAASASGADGITTTTLKDTSAESVSKTSVDGSTFLVKRYKDSGRVEMKEVSDVSVDSWEAADVEASAIAVNTNAFIRDLGDCASLYSSHAYAGASAELTADIQSFTVSQILALLSELIDLPSVDGIDLDTVLRDLARALQNGTVGASFTAGLYDADTGFLSTAELKAGTSAVYNASTSQLDVIKTVTGVHIAPVAL